jgi:hypothetical protein
MKGLDNIGFLCKISAVEGVLHLQLSMFSAVKNTTPSKMETHQKE